jgi:hypothetical protein
VKLFQIEEPEGGPADAGTPGAAIGIDASGAVAEIAVSVGGNAVVLADREGFEQRLAVPPVEGMTAQWRELFEGARLRAERALARPVTHAVVVFRVLPDAAPPHLVAGADEAGLTILRLAVVSDLSAGSVPALYAAILAEELGPRPDPGLG